MRRELPTTIGVYTERLGDLPGLPAYFRLLDTPEGVQRLGDEPFTYIRRNYLRYLRLLQALSELSHEDVDLIRRAHEEMARAGINSNSNRARADHFLEVLGEDKAQLRRCAEMACHENSSIFQAALMDLYSRMSDAVTIPIDQLNGQNPAASWAIFSWRLELSPEAMIHFFMYHIAERTIRAGLSAVNRDGVQELIRHKDFLPLGDVLALHIAQAQGDPVIARVWSTPRDRGGTQWLSAEKQTIFNRVVREE